MERLQSLSDEPKWRFYRLTAVVAWGLVTGLGYGVVVALFWIFDYYVHRHGSVIGLAGGLVIIVAVFGACTVWSLLSGVRETPEGLVTFANFSRSRVPWEDIETFGEGTTAMGFRRAVAHCRSGRTVTLAVAQGKRVTWRGGATNDIVGVLTDRLTMMRE